MLEDYQNKVCVVTGAASGIGKALCEKLVALGAQVYALDRNAFDKNKRKAQEKLGKAIGL